MLAELTSMPLGDVLRRAATLWPERPALHGEHRSWTWRELDDEVDRVACQLEAAGFAPGDAIAFLLVKRPEVAIGFLACARMGAIQVPVNHKLHPDQVHDQFVTAGVRGVFTEHAFDTLLHHLLPILPDPRKIIYVDGKGRHGDGTWADNEAFGGRRSTFPATADTPCYYNYTSGSTGRPKGAVTTSRNILVNAVATADGLGFAEDEVYLGMFSVFAHPHELFHRSILFGGAFVIIDTLSPRQVVDAINRFQVTWMMAVPSFYEMVLDYCNESSVCVPSLRVMEAGGAYVSPETLERMESAFNTRFLPVWGCTEATGVALGMLAQGPRRPGSTGKPIATYDMRIVDEEGYDVAAGEAGELWIKGEAVVSSYVSMPEETAAAFQNGWYATSDLVRRDEDGFIYFTGRRSEMMKIGGIRVFPLEIEQVIALHPEVKDVVVVRAEERLRGEVPRAVIACHPGSTLTLRKIQAYCRDRMANYKVPRIVEFWSEIPKLPNGKVDKKAILARSVDPARDERGPRA
jgi:long-chain acyl-CoA synthetase